MENLNFGSYSKKAAEMSIQGYENKLFVYIMGLSGEAGEVSEKFKKLYRDAGGNMTDTFKEEVRKELGDVLWYVNALGAELGFSLEEIAQGNLDKISSRRARNVQQGSGDNR